MTMHEQLVAARRQRDAAQVDLERAVVRARAAGMSLRDVGLAAGLSAQGVADMERRRLSLDALAAADAEVRGA